MKDFLNYNTWKNLLSDVTENREKEKAQRHTYTETMT